jgi:hypothetical protein
LTEKRVTPSILNQIRPSLGNSSIKASSINDRELVQVGSMRTEEAFVAAVSKSRAREAHDRWIPVQYWLEKLQHILSELDIFIKLTPKQLVTKLEKRGYLNREYSSDEHTFGAIKKIHSNNKKLTVESAKEKRIYFLFLESKNEPPSWSTAERWQEYFDNFMRRQTHRLRVERRSSGSNQEELRVATVVEEPPSALIAAPRSVTPTAVDELDTDIKALLEPFFTDLSCLFKGDNGALRNAIKAFGCRMQLIGNEVAAKAKKADEDLSTLNTMQIHKTFLESYCCPPQKSCIQGFLTLAKKVDEECPQADIFQLTKHGGSKGRGNTLVPIIPTTARDKVLQ